MHAAAQAAAEDAAHLAPLALMLGKYKSMGFDVSAVDPYGNTALHLAVRVGGVGAVKLLLAFDANAQLRNSSRSLPVDLGRKGGHYDVVALLEMLISRPASLDDIRSIGQAMCDAAEAEAVARAAALADGARRPPSAISNHPQSSSALSGTHRQPAVTSPADRPPAFAPTIVHASGFRQASGHDALRRPITCGADGAPSSGPATWKVTEVNGFRVFEAV